jgi:hypothetical protein
MKTLRLSLLAATALAASASTSSAADRPPHGSPRGQRPPSASAAPSSGLQLASGLQTGSSLQLATFGPRLSDEEWRKLFPIKEAPQRQ